MHRIPAALLALIATLPAQGPDQAGADALTCRVLRAEPAGTWGLLVEVEVKNTAPLFAEPAEFVVRVAAEEHRVRRLPAAEAGRRGRAVPAGGEQSYWLLVPTTARPRGRRGVAVDVARSLFHRGPAVDVAPVTLGRIRHQDVTEGPLRYEVSVVQLVNGLDRPVDVVLLAQCEKPVRTRWLFAAQVAPGASDLTLEGVATGVEWNQMPGRVMGVHVTRAEVVDWTAVYAADDAPVLDEFRAAWRGWHRWDTPPVGWGGRFRYRMEQSGGDRAVALRSAGRFAIGPDGAPSIEVDPGSGSDGEPALPPRAPFRLAFLDLRRPSLQDLEDLGPPQPFDATQVRVPVDRRENDYGEVLKVDAGRIVASTNSDSRGQLEWRWTAEPLGGGYVVSRRVLWQAALGEHVTEQREHVLLPGGVAFPTRLVRDERYGELRTRYELILEELEPATRVTTDVPPTGPDADALRAVWDAVYSYPAEGRDLTADVEVDHRNTDGVWAGVQRVRGKMRLGGYRGFTLHDRGWREFGFEPDGAKLSPTAVDALRNALEDRLGIWRNRDFCGRAPFDDAFRGAKVTQAAPGTFEIEGGTVDRVVAVDGVPREVQFAGGSHLFFDWRKVGGALVLAKVRSGSMTLTARFRDLGDGLVFPTSLRFERVFGDDWGPETLTFANLKR